MNQTKDLQMLSLKVTYMRKSKENCMITKKFTSKKLNEYEFI